MPAKPRMSSKSQNVIGPVSVAEAIGAMSRYPLRKAEPETVAVSAAEGRILAVDARAAENAPPFTRSCVDGFAIIAQDVARVSHRHNVEDLRRRGRDLEKIVLAQAVRWHLDNRILVHGNKTMVFD